MINKKGTFMRSSIITLGVALASLILCLPVGVFAENSTSTTNNNTRSGFCANISDLQSKVNNRIQDHINKLNDARGNQDQRIKTRQASWDQKIIDNRTKWDTNRKQHYAKLKEKAKTDTQKQAVETLEASIDNAVAIHRKARDTNRANFRAGVQNTITNHRLLVDNQIDTLQANVDAAFNSAKTSCSTDSSGKQARAILRDSLRAARSAFHDARESDTKERANIEQLAQIRRTANQQADQTFRTAVKDAIKTFRLSIKEAT